MNRVLAQTVVVRMAYRLPIHGHHLSFREIEDHPDPIHEAGSELVWIESREYITYGVMRGYAVWQLKEAA
jgi:hypothetical protein